MSSDSILAHAIAETAIPMQGAAADFDVLVERIGDARFVLLGEATHGTHDFYRIRAELTKRLIREHGFVAIAAEADWPDAYRVDRYIRGRSDDREASDALEDFERFPQWMWRNADVLDLVGWLRSHNDGVPRERRVGFYGLDVYSLHASMRSVIAYLADRDPIAAERARERYACFDTFGDDPQRYAQRVGLRLAPDCEREVIAQLVEMQRRRVAGIAEADFVAVQNARVVARAEQYYRSMYLGSTTTWNLRDTHMADTLDALADHLGGKIVVWAHNSHVGDASATIRSERDEINIGQLTRERHAGETVIVGFSTYAGTVTAAADWDEPAERKRVRPALPRSYEALFHETGLPRFTLLLDRLGEAAGGLHEPRLQRAIGVVYRPQTERLSHYYHVRLPDQMDAIIHVDQTRALEPLERTAEWERGELPETYPTGL